MIGLVCFVLTILDSPFCCAAGGSEVSIKKLAREAGYQSPAAFTRAFAQRFGMPPSDYRSDEVQVNLQLVPKSLPMPRLKGA